MKRGSLMAADEQNKVVVEVCDFDKIAARFAPLLDEYIEETANPIIGKAEAQIERWREAAADGRLKCIGAFDGDEIAGMILLLVSPSAHYAFPMVAVESIYLRKPWRKGLNGLRMLNLAKRVVRELGSPGFVFMAPPGSTLEKICERLGAANTHKAYWLNV